MTDEVNTRVYSMPSERLKPAKRISVALSTFPHYVDQQLKALLTRKWVRFALYCLLGGWALGSDPLGLSTASDKAISDELARFGAYLAPVPPAPVTVVAIDHASIKGLHNDGKGWLTADDWPLTYVDHGRILRDLVLSSEKPAAVFYDIFFEKPRAISGDMARLGRLLTRLREQPGAASLILSGGGSFMPMRTRRTRRWGGHPWRSPRGTATEIFIRYTLRCARVVIAAMHSTLRWLPRRSIRHCVLAEARTATG